jgi:hypothetical protein
MEPRSEVTLLLRRLSAGDKSALNQLMPLIYTELHQLASSYMRRERPGHTAPAAPGACKYATFRSGRPLAQRRTL